MDQQDQQQHNTAREQFESIKQISPYGAEYWSARELAPLLGYDSWRRFEDTIDRAKAICAVAKQDVAVHFRETVKSVPREHSERSSTITLRDMGCIFCLHVAI